MQAQAFQFQKKTKNQTVYLSKSFWDLSIFGLFSVLPASDNTAVSGTSDFWYHFIFTSQLQGSHASSDKYFQVSLMKVIMMLAELKEPILITNSLVFRLLCDIVGRGSAFFTTHCRRKLFTMQVLQENEKKCFMTYGSDMDSGAWNQSPVDSSYLYISKSEMECSETDIYPFFTFFFNHLF